ncbi:MAG: DUF2948 family protein [Alphaproteobacteria bacterium]|jgi:hypothetical protein|nr:DUF2948 family protein [Alphaproteobacteria bacterium]MBT4084426.1 DUF2948 family protein [Alphaproteobacteria bacterium]MBT4545648.1 DUF2948 family protein [Alphaproteobacteria bacterium]MBT7748105.1 DUF2948 family protein [Alphaproteobacteria bacterium]
MSDRTAKLLKLTAMDREGLGVFSACAQDALTRMGEMTWRPKERRFVLTANRYMWETNAGRGDEGNNDGELHYRVRTGMHFNGVLGVQSQGLLRENLNGLISLLAIEVEGEENDTGEGAGNLFLTLVFAAGGRIRLEVECIDCVLTDLGDPWTTRSKPDHGLDQPVQDKQ